MRHILLTAAILLSACNQAASAKPELSPERRAEYVAVFMKAGLTREEADARVTAVYNGTAYSDAEKRRAAQTRERREQGTAEVRDAACKADAGVSYC